MSSGYEININNAINYAAANGISTVTIPSGTFTIRNTIYMRSGISLVGAGKYSTLIILVANAALDSSSEFYIPPTLRNPPHGTDTRMVPLIWPAGSTPYSGDYSFTASMKNAKIYNLGISGNRANQPGIRDGRGYFNLIQVGPGSNNLEMHDLVLYDSIGDGIRVIGSKTVKCYNIYLHHNTCYNLGHDALFCLRVDNVQCYYNDIASRSNSCIRYQDVINGKIYNNRLTGNTTYDSGACMEIAAQYWNAISSEIYNNTIYESFGCGIELVSIRAGNGDANNEKVRVHHNLFYNCGRQHGSMPHTAAFSTEGINNVNVENNVFIGNSGGGVLIAKYLGTVGGGYSGMLINVKNNIFIATQLRKASAKATVSNSGWGAYNAMGASHRMVVGYNYFYKNVSGDIGNAYKTEGNYNGDPLLASWSLTSGVNNQDCHLKSKYGRYHNGSWIKDSVHSPCIDRGDPSFGYGNEPQGNGGRINIGMYGNTNQASLSSGSIKPSLPVADFTVSTRRGKAPLTVQFTDLSSGNPTLWYWDFGDQYVSSKQNPIHTYYGAGTFTVSLKVNNSAGSDTYSITNYMTILDRDDPNDVVPEAAFSYTPVAGVTPLKVQFTDKSSNNPTSWLWTFGDGTTSTTQNPSHTYTTGIYDVKLTVTNSSGSDSLTKEDAVKVTEGNPIASFSATPLTGSTPLAVKFTDNSYNKPTAWKWNFGDRVISTQQNPEHIYAEAGTYTVTLAVTNKYGTDTLTKTNYIKTISGNPYTKDMYDNRIVSHKANSVYNNTGYLDLGADSNGSYRSLLWFNLDDYKNKTFKSVKLWLYWYGTGLRTNDTTIEVYRPAVQWDPDNVSWNYRTEGVKWDNVGGTWYDKSNMKQGNVPYDSVKLNGSVDPTESYYELDVTQLVNEYVNNKYNNYGFLLKAKIENSNYIKFHSLENGSNLVVPYLQLVEEEEVIPIARKFIVAGDGSGDVNCDGKDDHIQINQAIKLVNDNPTKYSSVFLKGPFTYNIGGTVKVIGVLEGDSTAVIKLNNNAKWAANVPLLKEFKSGISGISISGFTVDGNRVNNTNVISGKGYYDLIYISNCSNVSVNDMTLMNGHNNGVYTDNCTGVHVHDNDIELVGYDGFIARNCKYVDAYNNTVNCRINNGIHIYNSDYLEVYGNEVYSEGSGAAGIFIEKYGTVQMVHINVYGNKVHNTMHAGIVIIGYSSFSANSAVAYVKNNIVYSTGARSTEKQSGGIIVSGFNSDIENNTVDACYSCGIGVREVNGAAIITGTVVINIRSNIITYIQKDSSDAKGYGLDYDVLQGHDVRQQNNDIYETAGPSQHNVNPSTGDTANIYVDPLYADRTNHDYHLQSIAGRWSDLQNKWFSDAVNSPCIDAGYADSEFQLEPEPNGERINIGAYGNTIYASLTGDHPIATNHAPVLTELNNKVAEVAKALTFTLQGTDEDEDTLSYTMEPIPSGATLGLYTGVFSWTPTNEQVGTYEITFTVSDGYLSDSQTINIGVTKGETVSLVTNEIIVNVLREATPTTVYNLLPHFSIGGRLVDGQNTKFRTLIMTDLTAYAGKTITSAKLSMLWYYPDGKERGYDTVLEVYRPVAWTKEAACWNNRIANTAWATAGGDWYDKNGTVNGSVPYTTETFIANVVPSHTYHDIDVTDLIQEYCNNTHTNTGFLIKASVENSNWVGFFSQRMLNNVQLKLTIQYTN